MKKFLSYNDLICLFIFLFVTAFTSNASNIEAEKKDSIVRSSSMYFKFDVSNTIDSMNHKEMADLIYWVKDNANARLNICGWADNIGSIEYNNTLSLKRAKTAKNYLVGKGIETERVNYIGMGIDKSAKSSEEARRSTVTAVLDIEIKSEPTSKVGNKPIKEPKGVVEEAVEQKTQPKVEPEPESVPESEVVYNSTIKNKKDWGDFSIRTNLLYLVATSFNLGFEYIPRNSNIGLLLNAGYAPFGADAKEHNLGAAFISPEVRYYIDEDRKWFAGVEFLGGLYNYKLRNTGYQGSVYAGGFTGGYRITLGKAFDMDFSLGLGFGQLKYCSYYHNGVGNVLLKKDVIKNTVMPIQAGVSLIWKIF